MRCEYCDNEIPLTSRCCPMCGATLNPVRLRKIAQIEKSKSMSIHVDDAFIDQVRSSGREHNQANEAYAPRSAKKFYKKHSEYDYGQTDKSEELYEKPGWLSLEGRSRRSEYWFKLIVTFLISMFVALPLMIVPVLLLGGWEEDVRECEYSGGAILSIALGGLLVVVCWLAMWPVTVRRFHDRGMSGWWILWFVLLQCIPFVGWIAGIVQFVILGCVEGVRGSNDYGADPKRR